MTLFETFDIGSDTRSSVDDHDDQVPCKVNGKVVKVNGKLGPSQLEAASK